MNKKFYSNKENQIIFNLTKLILSIQPLNCYFIFITIFVDNHLLNTLCFKLVFYGVSIQVTLLLQAVGLFINHVSPFPGHIQFLVFEFELLLRCDAVLYFDVLVFLFIDLWVKFRPFYLVFLRKKIFYLLFSTFGG